MTVFPGTFRKSSVRAAESVN